MSSRSRACPRRRMLDFAGEVRRATGMPTLPIAAKIRMSRPARQRHSPRGLGVDMVAWTRAHMADPHIVRKIEEGR